MSGWGEKLRSFHQRSGTARLTASIGATIARLKGKKGKGAFGDLHKDHEVKNEDLAADVLNKKKKERVVELTDNCVGRLAAHKYFEGTTIGVIILNALQIGWDADYTARFERHNINVLGFVYQGPPHFVAIEFFFAIYFTSEILIRFFAYKHKSDCIHSGWFVFDSCLVVMMVMDTWILPMTGLGGAMAQFSVLRLVRLVRVARLARLMRAFPELLMILKGLKQAARAVFWTAVLMVLLAFAWAIMFTNEFHQGKIPDGEEETEAQVHFGSMGKSMFSLFIMGSILDDVSVATSAIHAEKKGFMLAMFLIFIVLSSFMMLNLLVGIMCTVVTESADAEKAKMHAEAITEAIRKVLQQLDTENTGSITKQTYMDMKGHADLQAALEELEISERHFCMYAELLFHEPEGQDEVEGGNKAEPSLRVEEVIDMILQLRPGNKLSKLDFAYLRTDMEEKRVHLEAWVTSLERHVEDLVCARAAGGPAGIAPQHRWSPEGQDSSSQSTDPVAPPAPAGVPERPPSPLDPPEPPPRQVVVEAFALSPDVGEGNFSLPGAVEDLSGAGGGGADEAYDPLRQAGVGDPALSPAVLKPPPPGVFGTLGLAGVPMRLEHVTEADILDELRRRCGVSDLGMLVVMPPSAPMEVLSMEGELMEDLYDVEADDTDGEYVRRRLSTMDMEELSC